LLQEHWQHRKANTAQYSCWQNCMTATAADQLLEQSGLH
jgi:hypothetical protein